MQKNDETTKTERADRILKEIMSVQAHWIEMKPYLISLFYSADELPFELNMRFSGIQNEIIDFLSDISELCVYLDYSPAYFALDNELLQKGPGIFDNLESHLSLEERVIVGISRVRRSLSYMTLSLLRLKVISQTTESFNIHVKNVGNRLYCLQMSFRDLFDSFHSFDGSHINL